MDRDATQGADTHEKGPARPDAFQTTQWSIVLQAGRRSSAASHDALSELCQQYWAPLYAYVRHRTRDPHKAADLTQAFFTTVLEKNYFRTADPGRGRFRAFLLTALKRFLANEWDRESAQKRGGGKQPLALDFTDVERTYQLQTPDEVTPEQLYLQQWANTLLAQVFDQLRNEFHADGKGPLFDGLREFITPRQDEVRFAAVADELDMSPGAVRVAVHRLRKRYREILRAEIGRTVAGPDEVEDEIRSLFKAFEGS